MPWSLPASGRVALAGADQHRVHRGDADPVPLEHPAVVRVGQRVGVLPRVAAVPPGALEAAPRARRRRPTPRWRSRRRPCSRPGRRGRAGRESCTRRCRASPRPCPGARRCRAPPASRRRPRRAARRRTPCRGARSRTCRRGTHRRRSSARSAPRRWGTSRSRRCCPDPGWRRSRPRRPGVTSCTTLPDALVDDLADVAQRSQVRLDVVELAHRDRGERGVLPVGAEDPRVVGPARAQPPGLREAADRRGELLAGVDPAQAAGRGSPAPSRRGSACSTGWTARAGGRPAGPPGYGGRSRARESTFSARRARGCARARVVRLLRLGLALVRAGRPRTTP